MGLIGKGIDEHINLNLKILEGAFEKNFFTL
jgi:hypothetical protein